MRLGEPLAAFQFVVLEPMEPLPLAFEQIDGGVQANNAKVRDTSTSTCYTLTRKILMVKETAILEQEQRQCEWEELKGFRHRHVVELVKSYQRGQLYGEPFQTPTSSNLERMLIDIEKTVFVLVNDATIVYGCAPCFTKLLVA